MKKKKIISIIFSFMLLCCFAIVPKTTVFAQGLFSLNFSLSVNGERVVTAQQNDVITVSFTMSRTDSDENYYTNAFQNHIYYDLDFFEFVEDSIVCYDSGSASAKKQNSIAYGEIIQCANMANAYAQDFVFCTFQLKVIGASGSGTVHNDKVQAFDINHQEVSVSTEDLQVIIGDKICKHTDKTKVEAKEPSCTERGWETHYVCNSCGLIFDKDENLISDVPYLYKDHDFETDWVYGESGHWHECVCGEQSEYSAHTGGTATCKQKAICSVCEQEYGDFDLNAHTGGEANCTTGAICERCGKEYGDADPDAHTGGEANCTTGAICERCEKEYGNVNPDAHTGGVADCTTGAICERCGKEYGDADPDAHTGGTATCNQKAICSVCEQEYGEFDLNAHTGGTATCNQKAICTVCGEEYGNFDLSTHIGGTPTCGNGAICERCGKEYGNADSNAHIGGTATCTSGAICERCGKEYGEPDPETHGHHKIKGHKYSWVFNEGYTGDVYCVDCEELLEVGRVTDPLDINAWAWWGWLLFILLLPAIIVVWLIKFISGS